MAEKARSKSKLKIIVVIILPIIWLGMNLKDIYDMSHGNKPARTVEQIFSLSYAGNANKLIAFAKGGRQIFISLEVSEKFTEKTELEVSNFSAGWSMGIHGYEKGKVTASGRNRQIEYAYEGYLLPPNTPILFFESSVEKQPKAVFQIYDNGLTKIARFFGLGCMFVEEIQFIANKKDLTLIKAMYGKDSEPRQHQQNQQHREQTPKKGLSPVFFIIPMR